MKSLILEKQNKIENELTPNEIAIKYFGDDYGEITIEELLENRRDSGFILDGFLLQNGKYYLELETKGNKYFVLNGNEFQNQFLYPNNIVLKMTISFDENGKLYFFEMLTSDYYVQSDPYSEFENKGYECSSFEYFENLFLGKNIKYPIQNLDLEVGKALEFINLYLSN